MKRIAALLLLAFALPLHARADDASRHVKAKEMIRLLHSERIVPQLIANVNAQTNAITKRVAPANATADQNAKMESFHKKVMDVAQSQITWAALEPAYIDLYARTFTDEELDAILAFYKSPAGASMVEKLPELNTEAQKIAQQKLIELQPQLNALVQDFQKEMTAAPAAPAKP